MYLVCNADRTSHRACKQTSVAQVRSMLNMAADMFSRRSSHISGAHPSLASVKATHGWCCRHAAAKLWCSKERMVRIHITGGVVCTT